MNPPSKEKDFLTFNINDTMSGMDITEIQEVTKVSDITKTPQTPDYVEGIINLRGNIVTIVNLGKKLGLNPVQKKKENQIIIIISENEHIGLMIDAIDTVIRSNTSDIESSPANLNGIQGDFFQGILKTDDKLIGILKTEKVLSL